MNVVVFACMNRQAADGEEGIVIRTTEKVMTTAEIAKAHAESEFEKYRIVQDRLFESDFDRAIKQIEVRSKQGNQ